MSLKIVQDPAKPTTLALEGRLDSNTAPELDAALDRVLMSAGIQRLVFDLGKLAYLSSAGIRCFVRARKILEPQGGRIAIVNPQRRCRRCWTSSRPCRRAACSGTSPSWMPTSTRCSARCVKASEPQPG